MQFVVSLMACRTRPMTGPPRIETDINHVAIIVEATSLLHAKAIGVKVAERVWLVSDGWREHNANVQTITDAVRFGEANIHTAVCRTDPST